MYVATLALGAAGIDVGMSTVSGSTINDNGQAGINCHGTCAFGQNSFPHNASGGSQWVVGHVARHGRQRMLRPYALPVIAVVRHPLVSIRSTR